MVNYDLIFAVIFYGLILLFILRNKKDFQFQGKIIALYRTKLGLNAMDRLAKILPPVWKFLGVISVIFGFAGMGFIFWWLLKGTFNLLFVPDSMPAVAPVLPGINVPGLPALSFWHWVIGIFLVAAVHEFSHGIFARLYGIKVKSSGFVLFGPILGAFVEPDEKQMFKKKKMQQLAVLSAGAFSNLVMGVVFLLLLNFAFNPLMDKFYEADGIKIKQIVDGSPADIMGLEAPLILKEVNGYKTINSSDFLKATAELKPGDETKLITDKGDFTLILVENEKNKSRGYMGVSDFEINTKIKEAAEAEYGIFIPKFVLWITMLSFWLFIINVGIGLFNLLPLGPLDGGKMFYLLALTLCRNNQTKAHRLWGVVSFLGFMFIMINLLPFIIKLLIFLAKPFLFLISMLV